MSDERPPSLVSSALLTYGTNALVAILSLVNVLVVSRALGAAGRGEVAFVITVTTMTAMLAAMSTQDASGVFAAQKPEHHSALATNALLLALGLGVLGAVGVLGLAEIVPGVAGPVPRVLFLAGLAALPLRIAQLLFGALAQAQYSFRTTNIAWLAGPSTTALVNTTLSLTGVITVGWAIAVWIAGQLLGTGILIWHTARRWGFGRPDTALLRRCLAFGSRIHVSRILDVGNYKVDQWIVGAIAGARELGVYSVAAAWADVLFYLPGVLVLVQRPDLARSTKEAAAALAARVFRAALLIASVFAVGLIVAAPLLCTVFFGAEFSGAVPMLRLLALGAFGVSALELLSGAMIAQQRVLAATIGIAVAATAGLGLDFVLVPHHGGVGASIAAVIGYTLGGLVMAFGFMRTMNVAASALVPRVGDLRWMIGKVRARLH